MRLILAITACFIFPISTAYSAEGYLGTWSEQQSNCQAAARVQRDTVYRLHAKGGVAFPEFGCERAVYRKTSRGWHVKANRCDGDVRGAREPFDRQFDIVLDGNILRLRSPHIASKVLLRC